MRFRSYRPGIPGMTMKFYRRASVRWPIRRRPAPFIDYVIVFDSIYAPMDPKEVARRRLPEL